MEAEEDCLCPWVRLYGFCPTASCCAEHPQFCLERNTCGDYYCCLRHTEPKCLNWTACPITSCPRRHCAVVGKSAPPAAAATAAGTHCSKVHALSARGAKRGSLARDDDEEPGGSGINKKLRSQHLEEAGTDADSDPDLDEEMKM